MNFDPNDPRYTAYILNELSEKNRAAVEREMEQTPELRMWMEETRAFTDQLEGALVSEPAVELSDEQRQALLRASAKKPAGRLFPIPVWATPVLGAAAALALAVMGVQHYLHSAQPRTVHDGEIDMTSVKMSEINPEEMLEDVTVVGGELDISKPIVRRLSPAAPSESIKRMREEKGRAADEMISDSLADREDFTQTPEEPEVDFKRLNVMDVDSPLAMTGLYAGRSQAGRSVRRGPVAYGRMMVQEPSPSQPYLSPSLDDFPELRDNLFIRVEDHPLSTLSIDVDTASYSVMRKFLNEGTLPPKDAIRVEELINYFPYDYAPPTDGKPFAAHLEVAPAPWNPEHHLVRIALKGREISREARPPLNLVYLIDVSGSMYPANRLPLVKRSMQMLAKQLGERDHIALVVYAGSTGLVLPPTRGDNTQVILDALERLQAGGSTAGGSGIQLAYKAAREHFNAEAVNRVILCTDGDFNVGVTQRGDLERLIEGEAKSGVFLTVLGFGMGNYKDSTLELLSNKGNGNYAYIDDFNEARKVLVDQMLGTLVTIAKDVKIQVEFNPAQVAGYRLIGYENRLLKKEDFNNDKVDAGEIGAGHTVTAFYELIPAGQSVTGAPEVDDLKYQEKKSVAVESDHDEVLTVKLRYKEPDGDTSSKLEFPLGAETLTRMDASRDFRFAAAVAAFGQLLRANEALGTYTYDQIIALAETGLDADPLGYRAEFLKLARNAKAISGQ